VEEKSWRAARYTIEPKHIKYFLADLHRRQLEYIDAAVEQSGMKDAREHLSRIFEKEIK
jgi:hypothetical protein